VTDHIQVITGHNLETGDIVTEVGIKDADGAVAKISTEIIRTKDAQVHNALVTMGWVPPGTLPTLPQLKDAIRAEGFTTYSQSWTLAERVNDLLTGVSVESTRDKIVDEHRTGLDG